MARPAATASGFPDSVPGLVDRALGRDLVHDVGAPAVDAQRQAAADDLAQAGQVGLDAEELLRAAARDAEAGDDLVEDQQRAVLVAERAQHRQVGRARQHHAHVAGDRLDDDRGDLAAVRARRRLRMASRSLNGTTSVSATAPAVTPAEPGMPSVTAPEPAATSRQSEWPW